MAGHRLWAPAAALLLLSALASCQGAGSRGLDAAPGRPDSPSAVQLSGLLPGISALEDPERATTPTRSGSALDLATVVAFGADWLNPIPHAAVGRSGDDGVFGPTHLEGSGLSGLAYGVYIFNIPPPERSPELRLIWIDPPTDPAKLHVAAANYQDMRWDWVAGQREESGGVTRDKFVLPDWSRYESPSGKFYLAVVLDGTDGAVLKKLRLGEPFLYDSSREGPPALDLNVYTPGSTVNYDFTLTSIPQSGAPSYQIDYTGDSTIDSTNPLGSQIYNDKGAFNFVLKVSNDEGLEASVTLPLHIIDKLWHTETIADSVDANLTYSLPFCGLVDGRPAVAWTYSQNFGDFSLNGIEYSIASDFEASSWSTPVRITQDDVAGNEVVGLVDADGAPGVFYLRGATELNFVRGDAPEAASWTAPHIFSSDILIQGGASGALIAGHPAVVYSESGTAIFYLWSEQKDGAGSWWGGTVQIDDSQQRVKLKQGTTGPLITFSNSSNWQSLLFSPDPVGADASGIVGSWGGANVDTGGAGIDADVVGGPVYYIASNTPAGLGHLLSVEANTDVHQSGPPLFGNESINLFTGLLGAPMTWIAYEQFNPIDNPSQDLVYREMVLQPDYTISGFVNGTAIDSAGDVGAHCRALQNEGVPFVSYEDRTNAAVKIGIMR